MATGPGFDAGAFCNHHKRSCFVTRDYHARLSNSSAITPIGGAIPGCVKQYHPDT
jgi:hypothetical protein